MCQSFEHWGELAGSASAQLADLFPVVQALPEALNPQVRTARKLHDKEKDLYVRLWLRAKRGLETKTGLVSSIKHVRTSKSEADGESAMFLQRPPPSAEARRLRRRPSGIHQRLVAGSWLRHHRLHPLRLHPRLPHLARRPEKVQEEVDRVVGPDRLPTIEDYENLPYVRACIKESLRWMPTVILGVPHAAVQEDNYKGWRIPAGSTVINNVWAIHMDPNRSPLPRDFNPDRFASDSRSLHESATGEAARRDNFVFGAGRRLCQGIHIAERSLALGISRLVWAFDFLPALDEKTGSPVAYDGDDLVGGITVQPRQYACRIDARSESRAEIVRAAVRRDAAEFLDVNTGQWSKTPENMAFSTYSPDDGKVQ